MKTVAALLLFVLLLNHSTHAQVRQFRNGYVFSNEEMSDILLQRSKQQKLTGWLALVTGPVLTVAGIKVALYDYHYDRNTTTYKAGTLIATAGLTSLLSSAILFAAASKNKSKAKLLLKNEATGFKIMSKPVYVTGVAIQCSL